MLDPQILASTIAASSCWVVRPGWPSATVETLRLGLRDTPADTAEALARQ
ncbi:hypothetical protein [Streptomyces sp. TBY4]|nr:hypothetical protein [Streptomyces sp. TBY4]MCP3759691.1 hypothetical protein [Streptomyces sp. TBY4]